MKILISHFIWQREKQMWHVRSKGAFVVSHGCWQNGLQPWLQNQNSFHIWAAFQTRNDQFAFLLSDQPTESEAKEHRPICASRLRHSVWTSVFLQERAKQNDWTTFSHIDRYVTFMSTWITTTVWYSYWAPLLCHTAGQDTVFHCSLTLNNWLNSKSHLQQT